MSSSEKLYTPYVYTPPFSQRSRYLGELALPAADGYFVDDVPFLIVESDACVKDPDAGLAEYRAEYFGADENYYPTDY